MKKLDVGALRDEAYHILDECDGDIAVLQAMEALKISPENAESYLQLAESAEEKDRFDKALIWVDQGLIEHPGHAALMLKKASLLLDGFEEVDEAFAILSAIDEQLAHKSALEIKKLFDLELVLDAYLLLTDCYRLKSSYNKAHEYAHKAFALDPPDEAALLAAATAHFELGDYDQALSMIEPLDARQDQSDFYWLKAQILSAKGLFEGADEAFIMANKLDKGRYHRPIRISQSSFFNAFEQASLALPKEIRDFLDTIAVEIKSVVPLELVVNSAGSLSPLAFIYVKQEPKKAPVVYLFHRSIENLALKKSDMRDLIASALLHELGKAVQK